jgi:hypothetical protein
VFDQRESGRAIALWDAVSGKKIWKKAIDRDVWPLGFLADDAAFALDTSAAIETRSGSGELVRRFASEAWTDRGTVFRPVEASLSADGNVVFIRDRIGALQEWDAARGKLVRDFGKEFKAQYFLSRLGPMIGKRNGFVSLAHLDELAKENPGRWGKRPMAISGDGRFVATSRHFDVPIDERERNRGKGEIVIWDVPGRKATRNFLSPALALGFSGDGKRLVAASEKALTVWSLETGMELWRSEDGKIYLNGNGFALSPDGAMALTADGSAEVGSSLPVDARLWDVLNGKLHRLLSEPQD